MNSYWQIFVDPDIPLGQRVGLAALFPILGPLSLGGCRPLEPDAQRPLPSTDTLRPLPTTDAAATDAGTRAPEITPVVDTYTCVPESCVGGLIDTSRVSEGRVRCIAFTETAAATGLVVPPAARRIAPIDIDHDAWPDLYVVHADAANTLWRNTDGAQWTESAAVYALDLVSPSRDAAWGDADADGDDDLYLVTAQGSRLYERVGDSFVPWPEMELPNDPEPGTTAAWVGTDLFLATENGTRWYTRHADGTYTERALDAGLWDAGEGTRIAVADYNGDAQDDIFLANMTGANRLWRNNGDNTFTDVSLPSLAPTLSQSPSMDAAWVRYQGEAAPALYVASWEGANQFYVPQADGDFADHAPALNLRAFGNTTRAVWGDLLGEQRPALLLGRVDAEILLYLPELDAVDQHVLTYHDIAAPLGLAQFGTVLDATWRDIDRDDRLDLVLLLAEAGLRIFHNESRWIRTCEPPEGR